MAIAYQHNYPSRAGAGKDFSSQATFESKKARKTMPKLENWFVQAACCPVFLIVTTV